MKTSFSKKFFNKSPFNKKRKNDDDINAVIVDDGSMDSDTTKTIIKNVNVDDDNCSGGSCPPPLPPIDTPEGRRERAKRWNLGGGRLTPSK